MHRLLLFALLLGQSGSLPSTLPKLQIEAPAEFAAIRTRFQSMDPQHFADIMQLTGATDAGSAIRVALVPEDSDLAREMSSWIAGFAMGESDLVVIFPARSPSYPDGTLEDVLRHEVAHVLIWRVSAGRPIPRWFNEGLAMAAERKRGFDDQTELLYELVTGPRTSLAELNRLFSGGQTDQTRAYALAGAVVHEMLQQFGPAICGEILRRVGRGDPFDSAFQSATGVTPDTMEAEFWHSQSVWTLWAPIMTSSTVLWLAVTLLAILAIYMRRRRNRAIEERWEKEGDDGDDDDSPA